MTIFTQGNTLVNALKQDSQGQSAIKVWLIHLLNHKEEDGIENHFVPFPRSQLVFWWQLPPNRAPGDESCIANVWRDSKHQGGPRFHNIRIRRVSTMHCFCKRKDRVRRELPIARQDYLLLKDFHYCIPGWVIIFWSTWWKWEQQQLKLELVWPKVIVPNCVSNFIWSLPEGDW